jgi:hypothetical protein
MRILFLFAVLTMSCITVHSQCSPSDVQKQANVAHAIQARLQSQHRRFPDLEPAPAVTKEVPTFRIALANVTKMFFRCRTSSDEDSTSIEASLASILHANKPERNVTLSPEQDLPDITYGNDLRVTVKKLTELPHSLTVQLTFGTACGDDNTLLIYTRSEEAWHKRLEWHSSRYTKASDSFGDFFHYILLPPNASGGEDRIAVAHGTPWCTSRYSSFSVDLLELAGATTPQRLLSHVKESYTRDEEVPPLKRTPNGFELHATISGDDADHFSMSTVFRYDVRNNELKQVVR